MATRVRLTADVDPDVKKRVKLAAVESDTSVSEWVERAVVRELGRVKAVRSPHDGGGIGSDDARPERASDERFRAQLEVGSVLLGVLVFRRRDMA